ncbi:MAG TPA: hypothetical protein VGS97_09675 [Actinocrinis sp.]|uniref:hypothetical protein n=1 Tax=Actinocrinis sp. TaxID=1920516 RepID=UPI002DDD7928|nr:hypothetical protein [Actinocrinis sp.]HEV2344349.1 hypothetical protein [Actinocrinis sp.]
MKARKKAKGVSPELVKAAAAQATASLTARVVEMSRVLEAQRAYGDALEWSVDVLRLQADAANGVLNPNDPGQREASWQTAYKAKSEIGAIPGGMAYLYDVARHDPDPGQREAAWRRIMETTVGGGLS